MADLKTFVVISFVVISWCFVFMNFPSRKRGYLMVDVLKLISFLNTGIKTLLQWCDIGLENMLLLHPYFQWYDKSSTKNLAEWSQQWCGVISCLYESFWSPAGHVTYVFSHTSNLFFVLGTLRPFYDRISLSRTISLKSYRFYSQIHKLLADSWHEVWFDDILLFHTITPTKKPISFYKVSYHLSLGMVLKSVVKLSLSLIDEP